MPKGILHEQTVQEVAMVREYIKHQWDLQPLRLIIWLAIIVRLLAVIFSKGYGMLDDHFLVIEASQSWVDGYDYNRWLPGSGASGPEGHNFFYAGIHYVLFYLMEFMHFTDPQGKMYIIRLVHAALSLLTIVFGYKIAEITGGMKTARQTGLLLALLWFMPFLSVRNMVEMVCIPFLLWATLILLRALSAERKAQSVNLIEYFWAGILLGIAFSIRYQTLIFTGGVGLVLLYFRQAKGALVMAGTFLATIFLTLAIIDIFIWGYPFAELSAYIDHNITHRANYIVAPWYNYLLLILGLMIPPVSFLLLFGFFKKGMQKKALVVFLPALLFLVFHSIFPNKQERFILPVIPFLVILGTAGWDEFVRTSKFWQGRKRLLNACWVFFWAVNLILLPIVSTTYSKRAKVESMTYLSRYDDIRYILFENSNKYGQLLFPRYYLDEWIKYAEFTRDNIDNPFPEDLKTNPYIIPRFFVFVEEENLQERVAYIQRHYPNMVYETTIKPGFIDKLLYLINPINANETITIYRNASIIPAMKND